MSQILRLNGNEADSLIGQLAEIHRNEIHEGLLSTMGEAFLKKLYRTLASSPHSFVCVLKEDNLIVGFICGSLDTGLVYKNFIRRAGIRAFLMIFPKLVSLSRVKSIFETLLYPSKQENDELPRAEILNFCVRAQCQGRGTGGQLFAALCNEFRMRGVKSIRIVTGERQVSAQHFYRARGAVFVRHVEVHRGARSLVYVYNIGSDSASSVSDKLPSGSELEREVISR